LHILTKYFPTNILAELSRNNDVAMMMMFIYCIIFSQVLLSNLIAVATAAVNQMDRGEVLRLDYDNYDKLTESRTVFIFFFAPW
jgi:hypothetical protein